MIYLLTLYSVSLVLVGIFVAANNPGLAQKFKTNGRKALDAGEKLANKIRQ